MAIPVAFGYFGACGLGALALAAFGRDGRSGRSGESAAIGTLQAFALGLGFLFVGLYGGQLAGLEALLFGTFLGITASQVTTLLCIALAVVGVLAILGRPLLFASVDGAVARAGGVPTGSSTSPSCCCSAWRSRRPRRSPAPSSSSPCW